MLAASQTISISIERPPDTVYAFLADPLNLPRWAKGLCISIENKNGQWIVGTPGGFMEVRFVEKNAFRVLDHYVKPSPGVEVYVPMRVLANGPGSEVVFTLFRQPKMTDAKFAEDASLVAQDLQTLKSILEK